MIQTPNSMATNTGEELSAEAQQWMDNQGLYSHAGMLLGKLIEKEYLPRVQNFDFSEEDILISTYPRSGTTWTQEMVWLICNNADIEGAKNKQLGERAPGIEFPSHSKNKHNVEVLEEMLSPRIVKTHFTPQYFEKYGKINFKIIAVMRNPKDVAVSVYHFYKNLQGFNGKWDDIFKMFKSGYIKYGSWLRHSLRLWEVRDDPNVLLLKYEDAKADHVGVIRKIADFLGKSLTEEQINIIADYTKVGNMRKVHQSSELVKKEGKYKDFIRRGVVGEWSIWFTEQQLNEMDEILNEAKAHGLTFTDDITK